MRWHSSRNDWPSKVNDKRRVVRSNSFTPRRASSASSRRPITAGVTPSIRAAAERLPRVAELTKGFDLFELVHGCHLIPEVKDHFSAGVLIFAKGMK
jgi:hypothetical protein